MAAKAGAAVPPHLTRRSAPERSQRSTWGRGRGAAGGPKRAVWLGCAGAAPSALRRFVCPRSPPAQGDRGLVGAARGRRNPGAYLAGACRTVPLAARCCVAGPRAARCSEHRFKADILCWRCRARDRHPSPEGAAGARWRRAGRGHHAVHDRAARARSLHVLLPAGTFAETLRDLCEPREECGRARPARPRPSVSPGPAGRCCACWAISSASPGFRVLSSSEDV